MFEDYVGPGLWVKLGLDPDQLLFGLDKTKYALKEWRDETNEGNKDLARYAAAITTTVAPIVTMATAIYGLTMRYGAQADALNDLSYQTGIGTEKLQQMQYAAVLSQSNFANITLGLNTLTQSMANYADKSSAAYKAFMGLGIDPRGRSPGEVFDETAQALVGMEDLTKRNQIAMDLYGRAWKEMLPYMQVYIDKSKEIKEHPWMTDKELRELEESKIELDKIASGISILTGKVLALSRAWDEGPGSEFWKDDFKEINDGSRNAAEGFVLWANSMESANTTISDLSKKIRDANREVEDLNNAIYGAQISTAKTGMEQAELGTEYNELLGEEKINKQIIAHDPETSQATKLVARNKEIKKRLDEIKIQMNQNQLSLTKDMQTIQRGFEDLATVGGTQLGKLMDEMAEAEAFAAAHPIVQQYIIERVESTYNPYANSVVTNKNTASGSTTGSTSGSGTVSVTIIAPTTNAADLAKESKEALRDAARGIP